MTRLKRRLYLLSFVDEFGPIYAVYTLWFNDNGISTSRVSTLFLAWAFIALVLEIPSGALADRVDRRYLLAVALGIRGVAISLWLLWPTLPGILVGVALWAAHDALASGSWEAMIHDQLTAAGAAHRYGPIMARVGQFSNLGLASGTLIGAGLLRVEVSLPILGWLTVAVHVCSIGLLATLPEASTSASDASDLEHSPDGQSPVAAWWATLRAGLAEVRHTPILVRLVGVSAILEGLFLIDEYLPLLARTRGGSDADAPLLVLVVWVGLLIGGEVAARRPSLSDSLLGWSLVAAMAVTALAFVGRAVWFLGLVAVGYAVLELVWVTTDARLQERISDSNRATVTSVRGFGSAIISMAWFAAIGGLSNGDDPTPGLFLAIGLLAIAGLLLARWLPSAPADPGIEKTEPVV